MNILRTLNFGYKLYILITIPINMNDTYLFKKQKKKFNVSFVSEDVQEILKTNPMQIQIQIQIQQRKKQRKKIIQIQNFKFILSYGLIVYHQFIYHRLFVIGFSK